MHKEQGDTPIKTKKKSKRDAIVRLLVLKAHHRHGHSAYNKTKQSLLSSTNPL